MMLTAEKKSIPGFFHLSSVAHRPAEATCLPWFSDLWQQTTSLRRLRQMETKTHIKPFCILGVVLPYSGLGLSCVQTVANSPIVMWHA